MEIQLATEHLTLPKKLSLQQTIKHILVKKIWGEIVLRKIISDRKFSISAATKKLIAHRKTVLDNVLRTFSTYLPKTLMDDMLHAVIDLQEGYRKALIWEKKYQRALTLTILNPLTAGSYAAGNFISPGGHFDDLSLAKRFVTDKNQCVQKRFQLACFYCFEDVILDLWHTMKTNEQLPCKGKLDQIKSKFSYLVVLWAYKLEDKIHELVDEGNFLTCGFQGAINGYHEYAARFFWTHCFDIERDICLQEFDIFFLFLAAKKKYAGFVFFIYSLLPINLKNSLILKSFQQDWLPQLSDIWSCLLHTEFYEYILMDILTFPYPIPSYIYRNLLNLLIFDLTEFQVPIHKEIFKVLWNKFSQLQEDVVKASSYMIRELAEIKAIDLLETVIQSMTYLEKEKLLTKVPRVAIEPLFQFCYVGNYDAALRYLVSFLVNPSHINQRVNGYKVLDYIVKDQYFRFRMEEVPEPQKNEVNKVIESVQGSLQVLDELLEKTTNAEC